MGGNAFENLSPTAFPRLPSQLYQLLKARWLPRLQELYKHVAVPAETPEKNDHGYVVCEHCSYILGPNKRVGILIS